MRTDMAPETGQHLEDMLERVHIHAYVEGDEIDAAIPVSFELF